MPEDALETIVAGVRCREVLAELSSYLDGELGLARVAQLQAHLNSCDNCARFGGQVQHLLTQLRAGLTTPTALSEAASARLHQRVTNTRRG